MYNRSNTYIHNNQRVQIEWFQFTYKGQKSAVMRELSTEGPSLTNSIEGAIERLMYILGNDITIYQDCGEEGIFRVDHEGGAAIHRDGTEEYIVESVSWHYFSKNLRSLELLYAQT